MNRAEIANDRVRKLLERLARERFYGVIEVHFENGRMYRVRKLHSIENEELVRLTDS